MFTSTPQAVEVYQAGTWWAGELLGWRHDSAGACQVWVRVVVGGIEETAWTELASLRLPERQPSETPEPARVDPRVKQELPAAQAISALRSRVGGADPSTTAALPMVRDAGTAASSPARPGGRRRAPEDVDVQLVAAADVPVPVGRHRAPGSTAAEPIEPGRHRAADTGLRAVVRDDVADGPRASAEPPRAQRRGEETWGVPTARTPRIEESRTPRVPWGGPAEPDLLTRPMRLSDHVPHSRRPRLDGSLSGV
ncbi:hypothetical protein [Blastococcus sp. TF02A-30]|uniref:hypothetical protein n=1 Tax=Blastococcus sp. TF02A-30 TaxID=2250580 RepID=UPI000DE82672|nr:hypothetical protein [Blastococcus sp. TF02A-30]RBY90967.1 hypothetical protein DQ241_04585 [Blastococcus sp. TF02A-30]